MDIVTANTEKQLEMVKGLFRMYVEQLGVDLNFQSFENELANLPGKYAPPEGILLLALENDEPVGCGAVRKFRNKICEMKRLYIKPEYRRSGWGRILAEELISRAVQMGYSAMVLDTLDRLEEAIRLYRSLGFIPIDPYYHNPLPGVIYWKLDLRRKN